MSMLACIEQMLSSMCEDVDTLKLDHEDDPGAKSPWRESFSLPTSVHMEDEVATGVSCTERMELESGKASDQIHPVKVRETMEKLLLHSFEECGLGGVKTPFPSPGSPDYYGTQV